MNELNQVLATKLEQLEKLLADFPELTHVYMRRADEVLVDVSRDQAKPTLIRHPDWTIEREQRTKGEMVKDTTVNPWNGPGAEVPTQEPVDNYFNNVEGKEKVNDVDVPPKPSEEAKSMQPESKSMQKRKAIQKGKK